MITTKNKFGALAFFAFLLPVFIQSAEAQSVDTIVSMAREQAAAETVAEKSLPVFSLVPATPPGTYWSLQRDQPPLPFCPFPELEMLEIAPGTFIFDDRAVDYSALQGQLQEAQMSEPFPAQGSMMEGQQ